MRAIFLAEAKATVIEALKSTFDEEYPERQFRGLWVSQEYPSEESSYPGVWVDLAVTEPLRVVGVAHREDRGPGPTGGVRRTTRWAFAGTFTLTCVAMTSLERDRLADEVLRSVAFGDEDSATSDLRRSIEANDLIALDLQWDQVVISGGTETRGTPWGTDDMVYEVTVSLDAQGEFYSERSERALVPLSAVVTVLAAQGEAYPPPVADDAGWV